MTSGYTRLETALAHREPDFVPFDLGGTIVSGSLGEVHGGVTLQIMGNMVGEEIYLQVTPVVSSIDNIRSIALGGGSRLEAPETSIVRCV